jgi:hypothetical protein
MRGRVVQQLEGVANLVGKLPPAMEKLGAHATAFWPGIHFTLQLLCPRLLWSGHGGPPGVQGSHPAITGLGGPAKGEAQLPRIFLPQPPRTLLLLAPEVVIAGLGLTPREPTPRKIADGYRRFTLEAPAFAGARGGRVRVFFLCSRSWPRSGRASFAVWL